jgi:hypothetical protein
MIARRIVRTICRMSQDTYSASGTVQRSVPTVCLIGTFRGETKMDEKILAAARRVARIQAEFDGADHDTTTADFMQEHGISWLLRRDQIMREISGRRTEAIWALGRVV